MANRFNDRHRPPHGGQNVFGGMINNPPHGDTTPAWREYQQWAYMSEDGPDSGSKAPKHNPRGDDERGPAGGSTVPRQPKPSKPSGGMKLPLTTKVGQ